MTAGEGSIEDTFGQSWDILAPDLRTAYEQQLLAEKARVMLGAAAVLNALETEATEAHYERLEQVMAGKHLSAVTKIATTIEDLAAQMGIGPYAEHGSEQELGSLLSLVPAAAVTGSVQSQAQPEVEPRAVVAEPVEAVAQLPEELPASEVPESPTAMEKEITDEATAPVTGEPEKFRGRRATLKRKRRALVTIFSQQQQGVIDALVEQDANKLLSDTVQVYLDSLPEGKRKAHQVMRVDELFEYLAGKTDTVTAEETGVHVQTVFSNRRNLLKRVSVAVNRQGMVEASNSDQEVAEIASETEVTPASAPTTIQEQDDEPAVVEVIAKEVIADPRERLHQVLLELGDKLYFDRSQRRDVARRLDETNDSIELTRAAHQALTSMGKVYVELMDARKIELSSTEIGVFEKVTGLESANHSPLPLKTVAGMMHIEIAASGQSMTELLASVLTKMKENYDIRQSI